MLTAKEIRQRFLDFFGRHMHQIVPSGPLIPQGDDSLLFTNAGMVQFKKMFLGEEKRDYQRAATCQKCLRVSGKHNDLENVGRTARHHTFFEMLGNFSFGDYFKEEAITWAWKFITEELGLPREKLWVTVYKEDDEAARIWERVAGLPPERIVRMGEKDNFWTMGDTGPCGPCSEIYYDQGESMSCGPDCGIGTCDCDRFLEIWNLVFTQFDQDGSGKRSLLAAPNIDTGMGLERIAAVCQGKKSNFDCDLFRQIIDYAANVASVSYSESAPDTNDVDTALRVIADHARAAAFLVSEGVLPSNGSRGYVLRRLIRRALRFATLMGVHEPFMYKVVGRVAEVMGETYPDLVENREFIQRVVHEEEKRFAQTLDNGLKLLDEELATLSSRGENKISGDFCFRLYDTYGFPIDIVTDVAEKRGFLLDMAGFEARMQEQKQRARANQKKAGLLGQGQGNSFSETCGELLSEGISTEFVGYSTLNCKSPILALLDADGKKTSELNEGGFGYIVFRQTPFYGESGGQAGDHGVISTSTGNAAVTGALKPDPGLILVEAEVRAGEILCGQDADQNVDPDIRTAIARNHTCTHLLHSALRFVLGKHVKQAGSHVDAQRLRFDFSHVAPLTPEELSAVERRVNRAIMADYPVSAFQMSKDEALQKGAMALFNEKYGNIVRVLTISEPDAEPESVELCGGTHLRRTGEAGSFLIISEGGVAAGTRRIEAVTGWNAYDVAIRQRAEARELASMLKTTPGQLPERLAALQEEIRKLRKAGEKSASRTIDMDFDKNVRVVNGIQLLTQTFDEMPLKQLREQMDRLRGKFSENAVISLAGLENGKVNLLLYVSRDLHDRFKAPELIKKIAPVIGGSGGGRADLAQAGGSQPQKLHEAFENLEKLVGD